MEVRNILPEHSTANHIRRLAEKVVKKPFDIGYHQRMSTDELVQAMSFLDERFHFIEAEDTIPTIDWLLDKARAARCGMVSMGWWLTPITR